MGQNTKKSLKDQIAFFGEVITTNELEAALESVRPIVVDIKKLEKNTAEPFKKAA